MSNTDNNNEFSQYYDRDSFWEKVKKTGKSAGHEILEKAFTLYYCLLDPDTPHMIKVTIVSALGYFIFPLDAIPDLTPGVGYADDLGALCIALTLAHAHIKDEHKQKAKKQLNILFGGNKNE